MKRRNTDVIIWAEFFESLVEKIRSYELDCNANQVGEYEVKDAEKFIIYSTKSKKVYQFDDLEKIIGIDYRTQEMREIIKKIFGTKKCEYGVKYAEAIQCMVELCHQYEVQDS